jgi:transcription elongation factor GreB
MAEPGKNYITPDGFRRLSEEAHHLRMVERRRVVDEVSHAASLGDRSENAEYIYGKKKLREIDRRLEWLGKRLDAAVVVNPRDHQGDGRIFFGATVVLEGEDGEEKTVMLVGEDEIDAGAGRISWRSPVGAALLSRREGDDVRVRTPAGVRTLTVIAVRYG